MLPIQEVVRLTGTTSRTLRHYDAVGVLPPSRVGTDGRRWYDDDALVRLQRVLLLRALDVPLDQIGAALESDPVPALRRHLDRLRAEQDRLDRQVAAVTRTITALEEGGPLVAEEMFDGFDHTQYEEEVTQRWGADAYRRSDRWWRQMSDTERAEWQRVSAELAADWAACARDGHAADSPQAQALAARHVAWLGSIPGTPGHGSSAPDAGYVLGLADMYVADPRFAAHYGGEAGATLVRDALRAHLAQS